MPPNGIPSYRAPFMGTVHMVSTGHYLASMAGYRILEQGGNAIDAGVAAGITLNVVVSEQTSFGGVAPIMVYRADTGQVRTISGIGRWPASTDLDEFNREHNGAIPPGIVRTVTPSSCDAWLTALQQFGTMSFEQVSEPAIELADRGFPCSVRMARMISRQRAFMEQFPSTVEVYMPQGRPPNPGEILRLKDLASTFRKLVEEERANSHKGREGAIQAARDLFYKGELAETMVRFCQEMGGKLTLEDMAEFHVGVDEPQVGSYKDYALYSCGPWCQGPAFIEMMHILEGYDLESMGLNSSQYLHTILEAMKLSFSDRYEYYGDPDFEDVPMAGLLSKSYAEDRRAALDQNKAWPEMPPAGDPWPYQGGTRSKAPLVSAAPNYARREIDTSYCAVVDRWGNAFSAATSDGPHMNPVVKGTGIALSARGGQSWVDPEHPARLGARRRPRLTPQAAMIFKDGQLYMPFGTPGEDMQLQAMVQMFLNLAEFGLDPQQATEEPRVRSDSFPLTYHPHVYKPGEAVLEGRIDKEAAHGLEELGHKVNWTDDWTIDNGAISAIVVDRERGILIGGADPRRANYAIGW